MTISVILLSHNVKSLLKEAIKSVYSTYKVPGLQVVVVDNASTDGSAFMVKKDFPQVDLIESKINCGFSAGNNLARKIAKGQIVLFLNPDMVVKGNAIARCLDVLANEPEFAAITCKVMLPNGHIDYSCHRGLPTVWNTFSYWTGLSRLFPKSKLFSGYTASYLDVNRSSRIECISGTFLMIKRKVLDKIGWWDADYFWNGEDIELCFEIKKLGYKIWYEATETAIHFKGSSSGLQSTGKSIATSEIKTKSAQSAASAMRIFVTKHQNELGPFYVMFFVKLGIELLEKYRLWKIKKGFNYA